MFGVPLKNLGLFAGVLVASMVIVAAILMWMEMQFAVDLGSAGTWIGPYAAAVMTAGQSYAKSTSWNWSSDDRTRLAKAYSLLATLLGLLPALAFIWLTPTALSPVWILLLIFIGSALGALISYALARLFLGRFVRAPRQRQL